MAEEIKPKVVRTKVITSNSREDIENQMESWITEKGLKLDDVVIRFSVTLYAQSNRELYAFAIIYEED